MPFQPKNREELAHALQAANLSRQKLAPVELPFLNSIVEHRPEDMTVTVEAGVTMGQLNRCVSAAGQWLPLDIASPDTTPIGDLLAFDLSGPRRLGYGTARDYLLGITVCLANGEIIKAGGKVVKNVAGYDLCKLFIGARHSLGIIVEGTFKLRPLPEKEQILEARFPNVEALILAGQRILDSPCAPVLLDAHNLSGATTLVVAFAGGNDEVAYQESLVQPFAEWKQGDTNYHERFWRDTGEISSVSVSPSHIPDELTKLAQKRFLARMGVGRIYFEGGDACRTIPNERLAKRLKEVYDPHGILPSYTL